MSLGKMVNYKLTEDAQIDLIRIHQWGVRNHGEVQADKYYQKLIAHFEQLSEQPFIYPRVDEIRAGYRRSVCGVDSFYYRIQSETVEIMAIVGQQDTSTWLRSMPR